ncbi:hypothetical protein TruAng_001627 [Truncatella angustata]|nr:hypothetical protein TruAng_001627 [Truncatella angustata]
MSSDNVPDNLKQRLKESYDAIAPMYNEWTIPHSQQRLKYLDQLITLLAGQPTGPISILELGCGSGIPVTEKLLSCDGYEVTANDLSTAQIDVARENLETHKERLTLIEGDMTALTFADASFDAVIGMYSIIHLPRAEQEEIFAKITKWLKPQGYLLANFGEKASEGQVSEKWIAEKGWVYWSGFGVDETLSKIKAAGMDIIVSEVSKDVVDASSFLWVIAQKR